MLVTKGMAISYKLGKAKILKRKVPLFISWSLTDRCNYRCKYCNIWKKETAELNTDQILNLIDKFYQSGTEVISFVGGEPLLRDDIGQIISFCRGKGIYTKITTNGSLISAKLKQLKDVNLIKITFNGPKHIHDNQRQDGSYNAVLAAAGLIKKYDINLGFNCVISRNNIDYLDFVLDTAKALKLQVSFQPLEHRGDFSEYVNSSFPNPKKFKAAISRLIEKKKKGHSCIANSLTGLRYLYNWPTHQNLKCWAGLAHFRITSEGRLAQCDKLNDRDCILLNPESKLSEIINKIKPVSCQEKCWRNTTIELNNLLSFNIFSLLNLEHILCRKP
ncbi:radical SAM protein [Candidatus Omnitrophota bacterium]